MSGGAGGSILAMIISLKNNNALLAKRKSYKEIRDLYNSGYKGKLDSTKKASPEYLKALRSELIHERRKEVLKRILILCLAILGALALVFIPIVLLNTWTGTLSNNTPELLQRKVEQERAEAFIMYINYGDNHFSHKEYTLAKQQYESAIKICPDDIQLKYNLAIILYFACLDSNVYCNETIKMFTELISLSDTSLYAIKKRSEVYIHLGQFEKAEQDIERIKGQH